jgi:Gnt-I system low-affinity gluconate transporter
MCFLVTIPVFFDGASSSWYRSCIYWDGAPADRFCSTGSLCWRASRYHTRSCRPTPGPISAAEILGAQLGWVILFGVICGIPCAVLAGPVFDCFIAQRIMVQEPEYMREELKVGGPTEDPAAAPVPTNQRRSASFRASGWFSG